MARLYNIDTNWSENHQPLAGEDVLWNSANNPNKTPCYIPGGLNLPTFDSLSFGDQLASIQVGSNLTAATVYIGPRSNLPVGGATDVSLNNATIAATTTLTWTGGSVTGYGTLQVTGTGTINGTSATDMPTLGVFFVVGDGTAATTWRPARTRSPWS